MEGHSEMSLLEEFVDEPGALAQCKSSDFEINRPFDGASSLLQRRSAGKENRKLGKLRACVSLDDYSPPPSASFTLHRPSWVAMEDIEIGATIRRKKRARKSLSREMAIEKTIVIQEEPLVYSVTEEQESEETAQHTEDWSSVS